MQAKNKRSVGMKKKLLMLCVCCLLCGNIYFEEYRYDEMNHTDCIYDINPANGNHPGY